MLNVAFSWLGFGFAAAMLTIIVVVFAKYTYDVWFK